MTGIYIILTILVVNQALYSYYNHINIDVLKDFKEKLSQHDSLFDKVLKMYEASLETDKIVKDSLDKFSDTLDLYKKVYDALNDGQAQLNFRVQHLEMLNSNSGTLTGLKGNCPYTPNGLCGNPFHDCIGCPNHGTSGIMYDTNTHVECNKPETIDFTEE